MEGINGIADAVNAVLADVRQKFKDANASQGIWESLQAFAAAVDWREPWILGLVAFQLLFIIVVVLTRHWRWTSSCLFASAALTVFMAERLNTFLAEHWKSFAKQPYFDPHGIFFSAVVSAPLLLVMFFLVVRFQLDNPVQRFINYLVEASSLLIKMKRQELRHNARKRARQEAVEEPKQERRNKKTA